MDLIIVPFHDYKKWIKEGFRTRDAHLFEHFVKSRDVGKILVVNRPVSPVEMLLKKSSWHINIGEIIEKCWNFQLTRITEKVYCVDFFVPDIFKVLKEKKNWWFSCFNYPQINEVINSCLNVLNMRDAILFLQNPMAIGVAQHVKAKKLVFDAIDNWLVHPQMRQIHNVIEQNYKYVDEHADLIITVSESLLQVFKSNIKKFWVSNGVDIEYFSKAIKKDISCERIKIGYVGKIQERVDFNLVEKCLIQFPSIDFIFVGPILAQKQDVTKLQKKYHNIFFTGDVHYSSLPKHMQKFDLAIIPHTIDEFTASMNPLKLYEYLAAGKPVITTKVAGVENISNYVYVVNDENDFLRNISNVVNLLKQNLINPQSVIDSINENFTWEYKAKQILELIK